LDKAEDPIASLRYLRDGKKVREALHRTSTTGTKRWQRRLHVFNKMKRNENRSTQFSGRQKEAHLDFGCSDEPATR